MITPELQSRSFRPYLSSAIEPTSDGRRTFLPNPNFPAFASSPQSPIPTSAGTTTSSRSRFSPSAFAYNSRIAIALVPCAAILLDLGGSPVVATLILGLMVSYILDSLNLKSGAFFSVWGSLVTSQLAFFFSTFSSLLTTFNSSLLLTTVSSLLCAQVTFLLGVWASVQFRWIQLENPSIVLALERILFASLPLTASSMLAWATISALGMTIGSSYYFMTFTMVFFWLYSLPRISSFKSKSEAKQYGGEVSEENLILSPLEGCIHTLYLLFSPLLFHVSSHYSVIFSSSYHVADLFLLFFIPFLFLLYASTRRGLWWLTKDHRQLQSIRIVNGAIALVVVVISLEIRVIFLSFGRYIQIPPPFNYALVTLTLLGAAAGAGAFVLGMVSSALSSHIFITVASIISASGALVIGFPWILLPLPSAAGFFLASFLIKNNLKSYFAFFILGSLMSVWFVMHTFWELNIWLAGMALRTFCKVVLANIVFAMAIPGLTLLPAKLSKLVEVSLIIQALLLCYIENRFFAYSTVYYYGMDEDVMYPSYMVLFTSFLGLVLVRKLSNDGQIGDKSVWILACLYSAKLSMLFISSKSILWATAVLLLAISPPLLLYKGSAKMKPWQGYFHCGVVAASVFYCHETIFEAIQWWNGRPPSDSLLLGFSILLIGFASVPIAVLHFSHVMTAKRALLLAISTGFLLILLNPPLKLSWAIHSDVIYLARQSSDDVSIYGFVTSNPTWPSWLLMIAILLTLAAATSIIPINYVPKFRLLYAVAMGTAVGVYVAAEFFLQNAALHVLIVLAIICASVFVVFTHLPSSWSPKFLPWVFALLVALFPVTYLLEGQVRVKTNVESNEKMKALLAVEGARATLIGLYAAIFMLIALQIKYELAALMQSKNEGSKNPNFAPRMRFMQQRRVAAAAVFSVKRIAAEGAWMPAVGNFSTTICFLLCLLLNANLTGGSDVAIFFLSPILLLLNQDSDFVAGFGEKQRYFPVAVSVSGYLFTAAMWGIMEDVWNGDGNGVAIGGVEWFFGVKNVALLVMTCPSHVVFNRFVWSYSYEKSSAMVTLPLNLPAIVISDLATVRVLGLLGVAYSIAQFLISRQQYISGMKYI